MPQPRPAAAQDVRSPRWPRPRGGRRAHRRTVHDQHGHRRRRLDVQANRRARGSWLRDCALDRKRPGSRGRRAGNQARLRDAGCNAPIIGDFHYNGHVLLTKYPECAKSLDKYRINPGNVGAGQRRDEQFSTICKIARDNGKPVRIGVNGGSLNEELVMHKMQENTDKNLGKESEEIINECMVLSALQSTELALECGLRHDQIIISCKTSRPRDLITVYRDLSSKTEQPLHLGLTEAGMETKGQIWSAASLGVLLYEGIGDTIRISLTPKPGGDRREEVYAACELLQALGLRSFSPSVTACPGCGRTTSTTFQELAERVQAYIRESMPTWKTQYEGVETMTLAVMGCIVNGSRRIQSREYWH